MSKAYMPFYIGDYSADTRGLTATEHGVYLMLIMEYWQREKLPYNRKLLYKICGARTPQVRACVDLILSRFFVVDDDSKSIFHERVERELSKMREFHKKQRMNSAKGNAKRWPHCPPRGHPQSESKREYYSSQEANSTLSTPAPTNTGLAQARSPLDSGSPSPTPARQNRYELAIAAARKGPAAKKVIINGVALDAPTNAAFPISRVDKQNPNGIDRSPHSEPADLTALQAALDRLGKEIAR